MDAAQRHIDVDVSAGTFASNIRHIRRLVSPARLCVVMKSDAYGHGLADLAPVAAAAGADCIGICTNPEAATVRRLLPNMPLIRLRTALPDELEESVAVLGVEEQIGSYEVAERLDALGRARQRPVPVHLKIDTGMGRSGFFPDQVAAARAVCELPGIAVVGVMTHFASADAVDVTQATGQLEVFDHILTAIRPSLPEDVLVHTHNSAAMVRLPECRRDLVRVGAACYGVRTSTTFENPAELEPVMSVRTRVLELREIPAGATIGYGSLFKTTRQTRVATVPVGFGEGYPRGLFNKGIVLICGQRCPVIGRVSLNVTTIDVTDLDRDLAVGDEVVLIGRQGAASISFEELADLFSSVHTEINLMAGLMNQRRLVD